MQEHRTKKQHVVPQHYLAGFSENRRHIYCFDKLNLTSFGAAIKDVGQYSSFYDYQPGTFKTEKPVDQFDHQQVEKVFAKIEDQQATLMRELLPKLENSGVSTYDIIRLAPYIAIQWMRTKEYRERILAIANTTSQAITDDLVKRNWPDYPKEKYPIFKLDEKCEAAFHNERLLDPKSVDMVAKMLADHIWYIGVNSTDCPFYTSDNPVVHKSHCSQDGYALTGVHHKGAEFAFPLTSRLILVILERQHFNSFLDCDGKAIALGIEKVNYYNALQTIKSYRQVYCRDHDFSIAELTCKEKPYICNINRKRVTVELIQTGPLKSRLNMYVLD